MNNCGLCDGAHTLNSGGEYTCQLQYVAHLLSNDSPLDVVERTNYHQYILNISITIQTLSL